MKDELLFPRGEYYIHTRDEGNTNTNEDRRARNLRYNTPENIQTFFFSPYVMQLKILEGGQIVTGKPTADTLESLRNKYQNERHSDIYLASVIHPTAAYSELSLMSAATRISQLFKPTYEADLIYDYPPEAQRMYWDSVCEVVRNFVMLKADAKVCSRFGLDRVKAFAMGHHSQTVSHLPPFEDHPSLRTIKLHHDHLAFFDLDQIEPVDWDEDMFKLSKEARLFHREREPNLPSFVARLNQHSRLLDLGHAFSVRETRPFGYQTLVNYDASSMDELTVFLNAHFLAYSDLARDVEQELRLTVRGSFFDKNVIQPCFSMFLVPIDGVQAQLIISPTIVPVGAPERAGLRIIRSPQIPRKMSPEDVELFHKLLLNNQD